MHGKAVEPLDLRVSDVAIDSNAYVLRSTRLAPMALGALAVPTTTGNGVAEPGRAVGGMGVMGFMVWGGLFSWFQRS
jgi:hypothetical protein